MIVVPATYKGSHDTSMNNTAFLVQVHAMWIPLLLFNLRWELLGLHTKDHMLRMFAGYH